MNKSNQPAQQDIAHIAKWNRNLLRVLWILAGILLVFEAAIAVAYCSGVTLGAPFSVQEYLLAYFLRPSITVVLTIFLAHMIYRHGMESASELAKGRFLLLAVVLVITEAVAFHHGVSVIYTFYVLAIFLSAVYVDHSTLLVVFLFSVVAYLAVFRLYIYRYIPVAEHNHNYMDVLATLGLFTASYAVANLMLKRVSELIETAASHRARQMELSHEVKLDSFTQLYNHAIFYEKLDEHMVAFQADKAPFAILLFDIDNFKTINDSYGHDAGNTVLLRLVEVIREHLKEGDAAFRYGGEEFTIIAKDAGGAMEMANSIRVAFGRSTFSGFDRRVTLSAGVCVYDGTYGGRREFFSAADKALYRAKRSGKNCVRMAADQEADPFIRIR